LKSVKFLLFTLKREPVELISEVNLRLLQVWGNLPKDPVIRGFPNCPAHNNYDHHEERNLELDLEALKNLKGIKLLINLKIYLCPTMAKGHARKR
jgi:hypothetical protein